MDASGSDGSGGQFEHRDVPFRRGLVGVALGPDLVGAGPPHGPGVSLDLQDIELTHLGSARLNRSCGARLPWAT